MLQCAGLHSPSPIDSADINSDITATNKQGKTKMVREEGGKDNCNL